MKALVVEDEMIIGLYLESTLRRVGIKSVGIATNFIQAKAMMTSEVKIVFLDINIKGREDGIEVATVLRKGFDFYAIFLSAHINPAIIDRVKDFSNSDFIKKPFEIETVLESIEKAKRTYRLHEIEE